MDPDKAISALNSRLRNARLAFVSAEPERGLGLEKQLQNYTVFATEQDAVSSMLEGDSQFVHLNDISSTGKLPESQIFRNWLSVGISSGFATPTEFPKTYLQFFKNTSDTSASSLAKLSPEIELLNNTASLTRKLENKVNQYELLSESQLQEWLPKSEISKLGDLDYEDLKASYPEFVAQLPFGHTGSSTFMIYGADDLRAHRSLNEQIQAYPNRACRIVQMIKGHSYTLNGCIYNGNVYLAGLSYQYTGVAGLTRNPASTVGNDWEITAEMLENSETAKIRELGEAVGEFLANTGFRGLFGIDIVVEHSTGRVYLIEINPRQVASTPMHTTLQLDAGQVPLSVLNLAEFMKISEEELGLTISAEDYTEVGIQPLAGSQLFLRSQKQEDYELPTSKLTSGVYRQLSDNAAREVESRGEGEKIIYLDSAQDRPIIRQEGSMYLGELDKSGFLLSIKGPGSTIKYNDEVARIQAKFSLAFAQGDGVKIKPVVRDTFRKISNILLN